jgi:hypothetical protein
MNKLDHLLWVVAEESAEVAHRASKCARFGLNEYEPGSIQNNLTRLIGEFNDLYAAMWLILESQGYIHDEVLRQPIQQEAKRAKVEKFLAYSKECGRLDE